MKNRIRELKDFYILWSTQALSQLGSTMTNFALTLWLYQTTGSALQTALLSICSYAPYVLMSIFAGALSDKWDKKKTMLACDTLAACCTISVLFLLKMDLLRGWHLYLLNALNGFMNTIQEPASDVAVTLVTPRKYYHKTSGLRSLSRSLVTTMHPIFATLLYTIGGMDAVITIDLITFAVASVALIWFVKIPQTESLAKEESRTIFESSKEGLKWLNKNRLVLTLILFLAGVNLVASAYEAALPAFILSTENGGELIYGIINSCSGAAMLAGSLIVLLLPKPKDRIRLIVLTMLCSLTACNFIMSLSDTPIMWCIAQILGWLPVTPMNSSLDVIMRTTIPVDMQGRVYSCRNTLQFFTIPIGYFLSGWMIDVILEPFMANDGASSIAAVMFGRGKGSGAAFMIFVLGIIGMIICLIFGKILKKYKYIEQD